MYPPLYSLSPLAALAFCCVAAAAAPPVGDQPDGVVITVRRAVKPGAGAAPPAGGDLVRHDLKDGKVVRSEIIYDGNDAARATLSPFGDRVAFTRADGSIAAVATAGGKIAELARTNAPPAAGLQWPAGDGGRWVYYFDHDAAGRARGLRRVNVETKDVEHVVTLNATPRSWGLSRDATVTTGRLVARPEGWDGAAGYDLSHGHGDLYDRLVFDAPTAAVGVSPDGSLLAALDAGGAVRVVDWNGAVKKEIAAGPKLRDVRWAVNSPDWVLATGGGAAGRPAVLYHWPDGRAVELPPAAQGARDDAEAFWLAGGMDFGLGLYAGEAPYDVSFKTARMDGEWDWDFGDGKKASGGPGRHVYEESGEYDVAARQGRTLLKGRVVVDDRAAPAVAAADVLGRRHVLVSFDEAVKLTDAAGVLLSGKPAKRWSLDPNGRDLLVETGGDVKGNLTLSLSGVTDRAGEPNEVDGNSVQVRSSGWPSDRDGILFLWETADAANVLYDATAGEALFTRVLRRGRARFARSGAMRLLAGGRFDTPGDATGAIAGRAPPQALSVEAVIRPDELRQGAAGAAAAGAGGGAGYATILRMQADGAAHPSLLLGQSGDRLVFALAGADEPAPKAFPVATLRDAKAHHVIVSAEAGRVLCYLDGVQVHTGTDVRGPPRPAGRLSFGGEEAADAWPGTVEGVAIYGRFIDGAEAERNAGVYLRRLARRRTPPVTEVEATLLATSVTPDPAKIAPYRDALVVYEYRVTKVLKGEGAAAGEKVRVAHFGLVNAEPTPVAKLRAGAVRRLALESFEDRPDLQETLTNDTLPQDFDVAMFGEAE